MPFMALASTSRCRGNCRMIDFHAISWESAHGIFISLSSVSISPNSSALAVTVIFLFIGANYHALPATIKPAKYECFLAIFSGVIYHYNEIIDSFDWWRPMAAFRIKAWRVSPRRHGDHFLTFRHVIMQYHRPLTAILKICSGESPRLYLSA